MRVTGLKTFNGTTDPKDHIRYYESLIVCAKLHTDYKMQIVHLDFEIARTSMVYFPPYSEH